LLVIPSDGTECFEPFDFSFYTVKRRCPECDALVKIGKRQ